MKKKVAVLTDNRYLYQKIYLTLRSVAEVLPLGSAPSSADVVLSDSSYSISADIDTVITVGEGGRLALPFDYDELISLVACEPNAPALTLGRRSARLHGEQIPLTEVEYSLLSLLVEAGGGYVSREELIEKLWDGKATSSALNVYVHYLRSKLERGGEKIILSSRLSGYKICEKYLREGENA